MWCYTIFYSHPLHRGKVEPLNCSKRLHIGFGAGQGCVGTLSVIFFVIRIPVIQGYKNLIDNVFHVPRLSGDGN